VLTVARLIAISLLLLVGFAEPTAAQSSAAQKMMSSFLEELLRELQIDEIIDDAGEDRVVARGNMIQPDGLVQTGIVVDCDGKTGSMIIRNAALATQDLYPADRTFCDALLRGLRERNQSLGR
jgi:hypothetical protein